MNASFQINQDERLIFVQWSGVVTDAEAIAETQKLLHAPGFSHYYNRLYDMREVTQAKLSKGSLMELSLLDPIFPSERRAAVAQNPSIFGMGRMYGLLTGKEEIGNFRMFSDYDEALRWVSESRVMATKKH